MKNHKNIPFRVGELDIAKVYQTRKTPNRMSSGQPQKLNVTIEQLRSIYSQIHNVLDDKVSLHLPSADDAGSMRKEVQVELQKYLNSMMDMSGNSLRLINVNDDRVPDGKKRVVRQSIKDLIIDAEQKYVEPFNLELNEKVRADYQEWEDETVRVSQLRENGPRSVNEIYVANKNKFLEMIDGKIEILKRDPVDGESVNADEEVVEDADDAYWQEVKNQYFQSLRNLSHTHIEIDTTRSRLQKLKSLLSYFENN